MRSFWDNAMGVVGAVMAWAVIALAARAIYDEGYDAGYDARRDEDTPMMVPLASPPDRAPDTTA